MAFQLTAQGTRDGVIRAIEAAKTRSAQDDQTQLAAAKLLLKAEVEALPATCNGCRLDAQGDVTDRRRVLNVSIIPLNIAV